MNKVLLVISILLALLFCASCASPEVQTETFLCDDGSYMVVTVQSSNNTYTTITEDHPQVLPQSNEIQDSYSCQPLSKMLIIDSDGTKTYIGDWGNPYWEPSRYISWVDTDDGRKVAVWRDKNGNVLYNTKFATKNCSYYSADGRLLWTMSVSALFKSNNLDSFCNVVNSSITVYETDSWYVISEDTSEIGETAAYTVQFGRKNLGVTIAEQAYTINLSLDEKGNFH